MTPTPHIEAMLGKLYTVKNDPANPAYAQIAADYARAAIPALQARVDEAEKREEMLEQCIERQFDDITTLRADLAAHKAAVAKVLAAAGRARMMSKPGCGAGGMSIEANIKASCYNGLDAWPIEQLRELDIPALAEPAKQPEGDALVEDRSDDRGYIVGNGDGTKWRSWENGWATWIDDPKRATRYYFRTDAMAVHQEDEDAWTIQKFSEVAARGLSVGEGK